MKTQINRSTMECSLKVGSKPWQLEPEPNPSFTIEGPGWGCAFNKGPNRSPSSCARIGLVMSWYAVHSYKWPYVIVRAHTHTWFTIDVHSSLKETMNNTHLVSFLTLYVFKSFSWWCYVVQVENLFSSFHETHISCRRGAYRSSLH